MMNNIFDDYAGEWAVVDVVSQKFVGRIVNFKELYLSEYNKPVELQPVFDFASNIIPQQNGDLGRNVLVLPHDMTASYNTKVIITKHVSLLLFKDLDQSDLVTYKNLVQKGADILEMMRAQKSGITLARNMPPQQKSGILFK